MSTVSENKRTVGTNHYLPAQRIETLLAERARRGVEQRMRAEAKACFGLWSRRRRRRDLITRSAICMAAAVVLVVALFLPQRTDTFVDGSLQCCAADACDRVNMLIAKI